MSEERTDPKTAAPAQDAASATLAPWLPLALLESVRAHDRPREVLEDEDLTASLPRRLGLTGVIETQIQRYREAVRRRRAVPVDEFVDLVRLVLRRPDAEPILREAGAQLANRQYERTPLPARTVARILPRAARHAMLRRASQRLLRGLVGPGRADFDDWPRHVRVHDSILVSIEDGRSACALYAAALARLNQLFTGNEPGIIHSRCAGRDAPHCEWTIDAEGAA